MSVIDKVTVGGTTYDLQDTKAQNDCAELKSALYNNLQTYLGIDVKDGAFASEAQAAYFFEYITYENIPNAGTLRITAILNSEQWPHTIHIHDSNGRLYDLVYDSETGLNEYVSGSHKIQAKYDWDKLTSGVNISYSDAHLYLTDKGVYSEHQQSKKDIAYLDNYQKANQKTYLGIKVLDGATPEELADVALIESLVWYGVPSLTGLRITGFLDVGNFPKTIHFRPSSGNDVYSLTYDSTTELNVFDNGQLRIEAKVRWDKYVSSNVLNLSWADAHLAVTDGGVMSQAANALVNAANNAGRVQALEDAFYLDIVAAGEGNLLTGTVVDSKYITDTGTSGNYGQSQITRYAVQANKTYHIFGVSKFNIATCLVGFSTSADTTQRYDMILVTPDARYRYYNFAFTPNADGYIGITQLKKDVTAGLTLLVNEFAPNAVVKLGNLETALQECFVATADTNSERSGSFTRLSEIINPDGTLGPWSGHDTHTVISYPVKKNETVVVYGRSMLIGTYYPLAVFGTNADRWTHEIISPVHGNVMTDYEVPFTAPSNGFVMLYVINDGEHGDLKCYAPEYSATGVKKRVKIQAFGDSITDNYNNTWTGHTTWLNYIEDILSPYFDLTMINSAWGGAALSNQNTVSVVNRICGNETRGVESVFDPTADIIILWAGTNDWAGSGSYIGERTDADVTIAGALAKCIEYISTNSKAVVIVATPMQRYNDSDAQREVNNDGEPLNNLDYTLKDVCTAMQNVCKYYGIDCVRMDEIAGFNRINIRKFAGDGLHPHDPGANKRIASIFGTEFRRMILD